MNKACMHPSIEELREETGRIPLLLFKGPSIY
jgi:hypothetical protein